MPRAPARAAPKAGKTGIKINLSALQRERAGQPQPEVGDEYDGAEGSGFLASLGRRAVDLSGEVLKADHAARPLWIDDDGNM